MIQTDQNSFDWQGHRGCRGHYPENSIPAFLHALSTPVTTLEMDAAISKEGLVIISHEPWFNPSICRGPQGEQEGLEKVAIHDLTYDQIKQYDCGSWGNPRFPDQHALKTYKPSLEDVVHAVRAYCADNQRPFPSFNIEIKSQPEWDGIFTPAVESFADTLVAACRALDILSVTTIQSFDLRALEKLQTLKEQTAGRVILEVDGGINADTIGSTAAAGATSTDAGTPVPTVFQPR